ncbi:MAG: hypothetical protein KJP26_04025, partial [Maribacter sp.]|nr:hypothetical protein [Maribacter sp.]
FYEEMFGWKIEKFPGGQVDYYLIETKTKSGEKGISGGIAQREKEYQQITNFIQVDSIDVSISKLKELERSDFKISFTTRAGTGTHFAAEKGNLMVMLMGDESGASISISVEN